ncbi:hypothetical protein [Phosphitispora sp. TUW77]|uniref:hypothetical protein n=1 Tax=Phosphitispora sp. TUW77 TaxID=3152361 RepID=UPI003AB5D640
MQPEERVNLTGAITIVREKDNLQESLEIKKLVFKADLAKTRKARQKAAEHRKQTLIDLHQTYGQLFEAVHFGEKRLLKAFPGLKSIYHNEALEKLKNSIHHKK